MLYSLSQYLEHYYSGFNVFGYLTLRAILGVLTALLISLLVGPVMIRKLSIYNIGQMVRNDGPDSHLSKAGTPTMGGALILVAIAASTLLWADLSNRHIWVVIVTTFLFGVIGWIDNYKKLVKRDPKGLRSRYKYLWQSLFAIMISVYLYKTASPVETTFIVPFFKDIHIQLSGIAYVLISYFVIVGSSNAVNLTDGLDGLAIGCLGIAALAFAVLTYVSGHLQFAGYLQILYIPGSGELAVFCSALAGAALGFLWFNAYPAEIFMGDTGALACGGAIGTAAILIKKELFLVLIGGVFIVEALSVIIQVLSFKMTGRRVFKMAPIHHHFEMKKIPESKITVRFWICAVIFALIGLGALKMR